MPVYRFLGLLRGALYAAALLLGYGLTMSGLRWIPADPLLLNISSGADEFLSDAVRSVLVLYAGSLAIDVALTGMLRWPSRESLRLGVYLVFLSLSVLATYFDAPLELIWIGLLGVVAPLRIDQQFWLVKSPERATPDRTKPALHVLALLTALLAAAIFFLDNKLRLLLPAWACLFVALNYLLGRKGDNRPALILLLAFAPVALSLPLILMRHGAPSVGMLIYGALLLGVCLAMQRLLLLPNVRWANTLLFALSLGGLLSAEALVRASPLNALAQPRGLSSIMIADNAVGWLPDDLFERLGIRNIRSYSQSLTADLEENSERRLIVCLGGSSTEARDLPVPARWTTQLQRQLSLRGIDAQVINAGVSGYASFQTLILFREMLSMLKPDLVIVYAGNNDFEQSRSGVISLRQWSELCRKYELGQGTSWTLAAQRTFGRSALYNLFVRLAIVARVKFMQSNSNSPEEYYRNLGELAQAAHARGSRTVFVAEATTNPTDGYNNAMAEAARKHDASFLDVEPLLLERYHREELFLTYCHFNDRGSELLATILADFLQDRRLLESGAY